MKCDLCGEKATQKLEGGYVAQGASSTGYVVRPLKDAPRRPMWGCMEHAEAWKKQHGKFVSQGNEFIKYVRDLKVRIRWRRRRSRPKFTWSG